MTKKDNQPVIIITGMHHSGSSVVANLLQHSGLCLDQNLFSPACDSLQDRMYSNQFFKFHAGIFNRLGTSRFPKDSFDLNRFTFNEDEQESAASLIEKNSQKSLWGWQDPNGSLFLNSWNSLLGDKGRYILVYNHPIEVILSLVKRGHSGLITDPLAGIESWRVYNQMILDFYKENPNNSILADVSAINTNFSKFENELNKKLNITIDVKRVKYLEGANKSNQHTNDKSVIELFEKIEPQTQALYQELIDQADIPYLIKQHSSDVNLSNDYIEKLAVLTANLAEFQLLQKENRSDLLTLLLNSISPDIILIGKRALEANQTPVPSQFGSNEKGEVEQITNYDDELSFKNEQIERLEQELEIMQANHRQRIESVQAKKELHISTLRELMEEQQGRIKKIFNRKEALGQQLDTKESENQHLYSQISKKDEHIAWLENELDKLNRSYSLRIGRWFYPIRRLGDRLFGRSNGNDQI